METLHDHPTIALALSHPRSTLYADHFNQAPTINRMKASVEAMDENQFDSVSWQREDLQQREEQLPTSSPQESTLPIRSASGRRNTNASDEPQAGEHADGVDLAGVGDGLLECNVEQPLKENDGTKDAYVSYLVTTNVCTEDQATCHC